MEIITAWHEWEQWAAEDWSMFPLIIKSPRCTNELPASWEKAWELASQYSVVLESGKGGRFTYLGLNPVSILKGKEDKAEVFNLSTESLESADDEEIHEVTTLQGQPLELLQQWMSGFTSPSLNVQGIPPFTGGCIGFLGYDVVRSLERLPSLAQDDPGFPDYLFMRMDEVWIYDHEEHVLYCAVHVPVPAECGMEELQNLYLGGIEQAGRMVEQWQLISSTSGLNKETVDSIESITASSGEWPGMTSAFSPEKFQQAVLDVQEYIRQGDVFQVNLSLRQEAAAEVLAGGCLRVAAGAQSVPVHGALAVARLRAVQRFTGAARQAARGQSERTANRRHPAPRPDSRGGCRHGGGASRERKRDRRAYHACRSRAQRHWTCRCIRVRQRT